MSLDVTPQTLVFVGGFGATLHSFYTVLNGSLRACGAADAGVARWLQVPAANSSALAVPLAGRDTEFWREVLLAGGGPDSRRRIRRGGIRADSTHQPDRQGRIADAWLHC
jgi:hypothetical protein